MRMCANAAQGTRARAPMGKAKPLMILPIRIRCRVNDRVSGQCPHNSGRRLPSYQAALRPGIR
eukprot:7492-Eustigmatos_ZCMA.PRE.1